MLDDRPTEPFARPHVILVGGGLANGLIAWRLRQLRPEVQVTLIERGPTLGGNHTWSFHETDVTPSALRWLRPFVVHRWPGQTVEFPGRVRRFTTPYASVTSDRFHRLLSTALGSMALTRADVRHIGPDRVVLGDGSMIRGTAVVDGRGFLPTSGLDLGWQKFLGLEVRTHAPHGLDVPIIMDATVRQTDGYRFVYVLPLAPDRLLVEDTHYSDAPVFDPDLYRHEAMDYCTARGWQVAEVIRSEAGALPIALGGDLQALFADRPLVARSGLAAGLFHPTTGYSLPDAARLADRIAAAPDLSAGALSMLTRDHATERWRARGVYRLLNRMLFRAADTATRRNVLRHFYRLPQGLVERFYADRLTLSDKVRILTGRPPVPVGDAIRVMMGGGERIAAPAVRAPAVRARRAT